MPRDLKQFANENKNKVNPETASQYENLINKYKDMNQNELMSNLFSEAAKLKQQGKLDSASLNNMKNTLYPFLNTQQKEMLDSLVKAIDEQK